MSMHLAHWLYFISRNYYLLCLDQLERVGWRRVLRECCHLIADSVLRSVVTYINRYSICFVGLQITGVSSSDMFYQQITVSLSTHHTIMNYFEPLLIFLRHFFLFFLLIDRYLTTSHLMLSDDAVEDEACLARNSLFTRVLKTSKLYLSRNTLASTAFHSLTVCIRNYEPNRLLWQGGISTTCR